MPRSDSIQRLLNFNYKKDNVIQMEDHFLMVMDQGKSPTPVHRFELPQSILLRYKELDQEHQQLIDILNDIAAGFKQDDHIDGVSFASGIEKLRSSMITHFSHEEREMADVGFDGLIDHQCIHAGMLSALDALHTEALSQPKVHLQRLYDLFDHLLGDALRADMLFKTFLEGKGLIKADHRTNFRLNTD